MVTTAHLVIAALACLLTGAAAATADYPACSGGECANANSYAIVNGVKYCCFQGSIDIVNNNVYCSSQQHCPAADVPAMNGTIKAISGNGKVHVWVVVVVVVGREGQEEYL
jgi:hypothetical protein